MAKTKKKTTKTAVKTSNTPPPPHPPTGTVVEENDGEGFNPLTPEAFKWMTSSKSIPGAFSPVSYCGPRTLVEIASSIGRPIELDEAKRLVQPDGGTQTCALAEKEFQPVKYVYFCPGGLRTQIAEGKTLMEARLPFGGSYYFIKGKMVPISGSVFYFDEQTGQYNFANSSPLVILARKFRKGSGGMKWGVPLSQVEQVITRKKIRSDIHDRAESLVREFISGQGQPKRGGNGTAGKSLTDAMRDIRIRKDGKLIPAKKRRRSEMVEE